MIIHVHIFPILLYRFTNASKLTIGELLGSASRDATISSSSSKVKRRDPMLILAKSDFDRFLERLVRMGDEDGTDSAVLERIRKLRQLRTDIRVV